MSKVYVVKPYATANAGAYPVGRRGQKPIAWFVDDGDALLFVRLRNAMIDLFGSDALPEGLYNGETD